MREFERILSIDIKVIEVQEKVLRQKACERIFFVAWDLGTFGGFPPRVSEFIAGRAVSMWMMRSDCC